MENSRKYFPISFISEIEAGMSKLMGKRELKMVAQVRASGDVSCRNFHIHR